MRAMNRKLMRDLWHAKGQCLAIGMVIASGVSMFVMYLSCFDSLRLTQEAYYDRYRFADVFASLKRAPASLAERIATIDGVARVDTRVVMDVVLDLEGMTEPAVGRLISIPEVDDHTLNDIVLRSGRYLSPGKVDEVIISEDFALANELGPGDTFKAIINGNLRQLDVVGTALSPEFVYAIRPGEIVPDNRRFGQLWMGRKALASAFDMEGAFNDVSLRLTRGASEDDVIARLDAMLRPYGGFGAIPRSLQISHWTLNQELTGLQGAGMIVPAIFLTLAAFLLNVALTRIIAVQREQIAALKALGYSNWEIGQHFFLWSLVIALLGGGFGALGGGWLGESMIGIYNEFYKFPFLAYRLQPSVIAGAILFSVGAGGLGAVISVRRAVKLPPAEAMRPEPPASYKVSLLERIVPRDLLPQTLRMIIRNISRQPSRSFSSILGIGFATSTYVAGIFSLDAMDVMMEVQFDVAQRHDIMVSFVEPASSSAQFALQALPGVMKVEAARSIPVRLRHGHRSRQTAISGLSEDAVLNRVIDRSRQPVQLPPEGLVISQVLADVLDIAPGDLMTVEVLVGQRPVREVVVAATVREYFGASAYMEIEAMRQMMQEGGTLSMAFLHVDEAEESRLYETLKALPRVAGVALKSAALKNFQDTMAQNVGIFIFFNTLFASVIALGVVYNAARISLSERSRELASLRVLGFTRGEISRILLGELGLLTLAAIPTGWMMGRLIAEMVVAAFESELYRMPVVITPQVYAQAAIVVVVSAIISGLLVRRKLDRLDLVEVLKTRE